MYDGICRLVLLVVPSVILTDRVCMKGWTTCTFSSTLIDRYRLID